MNFLFVSLLIATFSDLVPSMFKKCRFVFSWLSFELMMRFLMAVSFVPWRVFMTLALSSKGTRGTFSVLGWFFSRCFQSIYLIRLALKRMDIRVMNNTAKVTERISSCYCNIYISVLSPWLFQPVGWLFTNLSCEKVDIVNKADNVVQPEDKTILALN